MKRHLIIILTLLASAFSLAGQSPEGVGLTQKKVETEQLPDLNIPRYGHCTFFANGELTVIGGHTTGFVPTATAEFFRDGAWHTVHTVYPHDYGQGIPMKSGKVLVCGGVSEPLGVGQTCSAEWYNPATHACEGFGCMDMKRSNFSATEIDSGRVVISGNWYSDDDVELFDGHSTFAHVKEVAAKRSCPYILRTATDNVMIFSSLDTKHSNGIRPDSIIVDQLRGEPFHAPLLDEWRPLAYDIPRTSELFFIGNEAGDDYAYLLPVKNTEGQIGFVKTRGTDFSLLTTTCAVPTTFQGDSIRYHFPVVDRQRGRSYLAGFSQKSKRVYVLRVDYTEHPAPLTLYYTDPLFATGLTWPILNADGNLILAGGLAESNYNPLWSVVVARIHPEAPMMAAQASFPWLWVGLGAAFVAALLAYLILYRARRATPRKDDLAGETDEANETEKPTATATPTSSVANDELLQRVCQLMEEQRLYLNSSLKMTDVATAVGCNRNALSACINNLRNCSFSKFVNTYRVEHAKQLLSQPDTRVSEVWMEAGFANETTFFRTFKAIVGTTPSEWKNRNQL
ncbi:MAG: helix-turn-helix domain-containing protein [Bacteroidales bacterium]|nr:helix-turn-helix domain-containing protein [Bacteroidales bacterium]